MVNIEVFKKYSNKYFISFDTNKLPIDFDKWIKLENNMFTYDYKNISKKSNIDIFKNFNWLFLNQYYYVVVESKSDFYMSCGSAIYKFEKGIKYLPIFPHYHDIYLKITSDVNVFIEPDIYDYFVIKKNKFNYNYEPKQELFNLLTDFQFMYSNLNFTSVKNLNNEDINNYVNQNKTCEHKLVIENGMMTTLIYEMYNKNIDENELYLNLEMNGCDFLINTIDKYVQYEFIKFYKFTK